MIIFKPNSFVYKPKSFWMLHLNYHFIYKTHESFRTMNFSVASQASHAFTFSRAFTVGILYNHKYRVFHSRGYLSFLVIITRHIFSFSCIQPCDSVGRRHILPEPTKSITKHNVDYNHALTLIQCDVPMHMQCNAMCHCMLICYIMPHGQHNPHHSPGVMDNHITCI